VILSNDEKLISRKVCLAFKQTVCGFWPSTVSCRIFMNLHTGEYIILIMWRVVNIALFYLGEMRDILSETEVGMKYEIELFSVTVVIPPPILSFAYCYMYQPQAS
jgi:hypothetical protein